MRMILGICLVATLGGLTGCEKKSDSDDSKPCTPGEERCECKEDGLCNAGLVCASGFCVDLTTIDSASSSSSESSDDTESADSTSSDGSADSAEDDSDSTADAGRGDSDDETDDPGGSDSASAPSGSDTGSGDAPTDQGDATDIETTDEPLETTDEPDESTDVLSTEPTDSGDTDEFNTENICERVEIEAGAIPNRVVIVQDLSSSLDSSGRWDPMKSAMSQLVEQYDAELALGAVPFPTTLMGGTLSDADCTVNEAYMIPPQVGSGEQINSLIYAIESGDLIGGTPTYEGLMKAREMLVDDDPNDGSKRYIILVTDGLPNCYDNNGAGGAEQEDIDRVTETVEAIHAEDITVFVVGYDMGSMGLSTLNQWAELGGTNAAYAVDDSSSLLAEMSAISGGLISCSYTLEQPLKDPKYVRVQIDGESKPYNETDGWSLSDDNTALTLDGASCERLRDGSMHTINVAVECTIVII